MSGLQAATCNGHLAPENGCNPKRAINDIGKRLNDSGTDLYDYIKTYWTIGTNKKADRHWEHAWLQYGTCMTNLEPECQGNQGTEAQSVLNYFIAARSLHEKYDVVQALAESNIEPGSSIPTSDMRKAIEDSFGTPVVMHCSNSVLDGVQVWFKVRGGSELEVTDPSSSAKQCKSKMITFSRKM
ncbi:hypothetical protein IWQ60_005652 [Tieghemiomyces parasiticus]|uniref:Uncharacterized protein n=1 Tax=Tieghemiomyces parasiticus TaxID=78921 RepID=A0A9W8ABY1_9FUNG|nr:hypothetical protein IWQ60_005652 [Tieghemiomyces parasiticus]